MLTETLLYYISEAAEEAQSMFPRWADPPVQTVMTRFRKVSLIPDLCFFLSF